MDWKDSMAYGLIAALVAIAGLFAYAPARGSEPCGTALVLAMDVSISVDSNEYELQRGGVAQAFRDPAVIRAIWNQPFGRMAVAVVEWAHIQNVVVPWTIIDGEASALAFADRVATSPRSTSGMTYVADAIAFSTGVMHTAPCQAFRMIIDVAGDGPQTQYHQASVTAARDLAVAAGIIINGLPIGEFDQYRPDIHIPTWYREQVQGGHGSFTIEAYGFEDFARAIRQKLVLEIAGMQ